MTKPARSNPSLGEVVSIVAVLITAVTQLYLFLVVLRPVAAKAALDEEQAQLSIDGRASVAQLERLELLDRELASDRQTLDEDRQLVASSTAATQAKLGQANTRDTATRAAMNRLEANLAAREAEHAAAVQHLNAARSEAAAQYKVVRFFLITDTLESLRNLCMADGRVVEASLGQAPQDSLIRVYDDAVAEVRSGVSYAAMSPEDRTRFDQLVILLRKRVEVTKAAIAQTNSVFAAYSAAFRSEWIRRGGPLDANGEPAQLSTIKGLTRAEIDAQLFRFAREFFENGGPNPTKLPPVSISFSAALSKGFKELVPELFGQSVAHPHQKR